MGTADLRVADLSPDPFSWVGPAGGGLGGETGLNRASGLRAGKRGYVPPFAYRPGHATHPALVMIVGLGRTEALRRRVATDMPMDTLPVDAQGTHIGGILNGHASRRWCGATTGDSPG